jgi:hypothetical protein
MTTARFCGQCGEPLRPDVRFCGRCGAPVPGVAATSQPPAAEPQDSVPTPLELPRVDAAASRKPASGDPVARVAGCILVLFLVSVAIGVTWLYVSTHQPKKATPPGSTPRTEDIEPDQTAEAPSDGEDHTSLLPQPRTPRTPKATPKPDTTTEPAKLTPKAIESFWAIARSDSQPLPTRLQVLAQLQAHAKPSPEELREIEALQTTIMDQVQGNAERERKRRAEFIKEAASGPWLQRSSEDANAVWRSVGTP